MTDKLIDDIRNNRIDINNHELFISAVIKGLMRSLDELIKVRDIPVPHIMVHTGSDSLYLEQKGFDISLEPYEVTNENYIYNIIPRCNVKMGGIDMLGDQVTNPYSRGQLQYETENGIDTLSAEFRRLSIKIAVDLEYYTDTFTDMLSIIQHLLTKLVYVVNYYITYMGQNILCSYKLPENFTEEHMMEIDGQTQDSKYKRLNLNVEVETNLPIFNPQTIISAEDYISEISTSINTGKLTDTVNTQYGSINIY